jgi:hypothetical protein
MNINITNTQLTQSLQPFCGLDIDCEIISAVQLGADAENGLVDRVQLVAGVPWLVLDC